MLRYQLVTQLRRDLLHGRLICQQSEAALLAGLLLQGIFFYIYKKLII